MPFGPVGPVWPGGAVTDIGSVCASRDLRLESKPHHRVIFGSSKGFVIVFCRSPGYFTSNIGDFSVPIENGPLGPVGTAGTDGAVTIIVVACATRDPRLEYKHHNRVLFGPSKGFLSRFRRFVDILPPNLRFCESH